MNITRQEANGVLTLSLDGRFDQITSPVADAEISKCLESEGCKLLLDMRGIEYMSSAGLRVLLVAAKKAQQKRSAIVLCGLKATVREVFDMSGFSSIFKIFATQEEAAAFLSSN